MHYPFGRSPPDITLPPVKALQARFSSFKQRLKSRRRRLPLGMRLLFPQAFRPLAADDLAAVLTVRNEFKFLRSLLAHYRRLGVTRFIFVDDASDDETLPFLMQQDDVDVWTSQLRFAAAGRGKRWREFLFDAYGLDRWYVNIDADEYLIYDDCFAKPLDMLVKQLEMKGQTRLAAPMIDFYPGGPVGAFAFTGENDAAPWTIADHFDGSGYDLRLGKRHPSLTGGPRQRRFGIVAQLMKFPVIYWDRTCSLSRSIHSPLPYQRNFVPISGTLLHFKFFSDFDSKLSAAVADGQYYSGASEYRTIAEATSDSADLNFLCPQSMRYEGPEQMIALGFMTGL